MQRSCSGQLLDAIEKRWQPGWQIQEIDGQPFSPASLTVSDNGGADFAS